MSTKKPEPYAPDLFSEHARLAQLGASVLAILKAPGVIGADRANWKRLGALQDIEQAARSLGLSVPDSLLDEKGGR